MGTTAHEGRCVEACGAGARSRRPPSTWDSAPCHSVERSTSGHIGHGRRPPSPRRRDDAGAHGMSWTAAPSDRIGSTVRARCEGRRPGPVGTGREPEHARRARAPAGDSRYLQADTPGGARPRQSGQTAHRSCRPLRRGMRRRPGRTCVSRRRRLRWTPLTWARKWQDRPRRSRVMQVGCSGCAGRSSSDRTSASAS